jgi:hypothetical protein
MHTMLLNCTQTTESPASICSRHHALLSQMLSMQDRNMHVKCYKKDHDNYVTRSNAMSYGTSVQDQPLLTCDANHWAEYKRKHQLRFPLLQCRMYCRLP